MRRTCIKIHSSEMAKKKKIKKFLKRDNKSFLSDQ